MDLTPGVILEKVAAARKEGREIIIVRWSPAGGYVCDKLGIDHKYTEVVQVAIDRAVSQGLVECTPTGETMTFYGSHEEQELPLYSLTLPALRV